MHIGFRLDPETYQLLALHATQGGRSVNEEARRCVMEALHQHAQRTAALHAIEGLYTEMVKVRGDVATAIEAMLTTFGHVDPIQARQWVTQCFEQACSPSPSSEADASTTT